MLAAIFAAMALIANAAYAGLQMAEIHYRTHILSRTWASLAVAVSADVVSLGTPRTDLLTMDGRWLKHPLINHAVASEQASWYSFDTRRTPWITESG